MSDIAWIGEKPYDGITGYGAVGVEFAVTAVSSAGTEDPISVAERDSLVYAGNEDLQWTEQYYCGYLELHVRPDEVEAKYFGKSPYSTVPLVMDNNNIRLPDCGYPQCLGTPAGQFYRQAW